jgi:hypothetical protein
MRGEQPNLREPTLSRLAYPQAWEPHSADLHAYHFECVFTMMIVREYMWGDLTMG